MKPAALIPGLRHPWPLGLILTVGLSGCALLDPGPLEVADEARLAEAVARFPAGEDSAVLVGAGDIARCETLGPAEATGNLVRAVLDTFPEARVFALGDNAYEEGTAREYDQCYDPTWGSFNDRTAPMPGNHEYRTAGAEPYFDYFDYFDEHPEARQRGGYYSFGLESWHVVALNSNISLEDGSPQVEWLKADLQANDKTCVLALWHHPLFSSGRHGALPWSSGGDIGQLWQVLNRQGGDLIVNAHEHFYERFRPQNRFGEATEDGMRQIVVGTGGGRLRGAVNRQDNSVFFDNDHYGVLVLTLHPDSYEWAFLGVDGEVHDRSPGPVPCRPAGEATVAAAASGP